MAVDMLGSYSYNLDASYWRGKDIIGRFRGPDESGEEALIKLLRSIRLYCDEAWWKESMKFETLLERSKVAPLLSPDLQTPSDITSSRVKFYTSKDGKNYGFTEDNIHFHFNQGVVMACTGADLPEVVGAASPLWGQEVKPPKFGEFITYQTIETRKGLTTRWWCLTEQYEQVLEQIKDRPVIRFRDKVLGITRWEGKDIGRLRILYPKDLKGDYWDWERFAFEKGVDGSSNGKKVWQAIEDPR